MADQAASEFQAAFLSQMFLNTSLRLSKHHLQGYALSGHFVKAVLLKLSL